MRVNDMCIYHRGVDLRMAQKQLDLAYVAAAFEQVRGKTMPQGVHRDALANIGRFRRCLHRPLQRTHIHMPSPTDSGLAVMEQ